MKTALINALNKEGKTATESMILDFVSYCEEMDFTTEQEFNEGANEYVQCQLHYGVL